MIPVARRQPAWTRRSPAETRLLRYAANLSDEALVHGPGSDVHRALARAERALRTAAALVRELDRPS